MDTVRVSGLTGDTITHQYKLACDVHQQLKDSSQSENVTLDLSNAKFTIPAFLSPVAVSLRSLQSSGTNVNVKSSGDTGRYIQEIGFPEGQVRPTKSHDTALPLCLLNTDTDEDAVEIVGSKIYDLLSSHLPGQPTGVIEGIQVTISEIIDNVDQHSLCKQGTLLVQYYPHKDSLDICVADNGLSIPGSYDRYDIEFEDDYDALEKALSGVSTKKESGFERGFGLQTATKIVCDGLNGTILLSSGEASLLKKRSGDPSSVLRTYSWPGTVFAARLNLPDEKFTWSKYV